jgi:Flp pilus assembly protein TadG
MRRRLRKDERGQAILVTTLFLTVVIGAVAITLDVGDWYREQRQAQATADAAVLAGAQDLPTSPAAAISDAKSYADKNGGGIAAADITVTSDWQTNDTVTATARRTAPGFFARLFGISSANVKATASARAAVPEQVYGAAPIVVNKLHPLLSGPGCPCFNVQTTLPLSKTGAPGAFGLVDLDPDASNGNPNIALWIQYGYDGYLDLGPYDSDPGASFNGNDIKGALDARMNTELLFPVYDTLTNGGSNAEYDVIGWVGFHLDGYSKFKGNDYQLQGYFTRVIWDGLQSKTNQHLPDFGLYSVSLVK